MTEHEERQQRNQEKLKQVNIRKCAYCKKDIDISKYSDTFVRENKHWCHTECVRKYKESLKRRPSDKAIDEYIAELQSNTKEDFIDITNRRTLTTWMLNFYDIEVIPAYVYITLDKVYTGTYKNSNTPISPDELLDMYKRRQEFLRDKYTYNQTHNKQMSIGQRINYDLAILVGEYSSYCEWKKSMQVVDNSKTHIKAEKPIMPLVYAQNQPPQQPQGKESAVDINALLDELDSK